MPTGTPRSNGRNSVKFDMNPRKPNNKKKAQHFPLKPAFLVMNNERCQDNNE